MRFLLSVLSLVSLLACSGSEHTASQQYSLPSGFFLQLAEGGGFTGQWQGYEVDSTGAVTELSGRSLGAVRKTVGTLPPETLSAIWTHLKDSGVLTQPPVSASGNMTRSLVVKADDVTVHDTWSPSVPASSSLDNAYSAVHDLISKAVSHP